MTDLHRESSPREMQHASGTRVRTIDVLGRRDFLEPKARRPGTLGSIAGYSDGHGLCYEVRHDDGSRAWYDPDELRHETDGRLLSDDLAMFEVMVR